MKYLNQYHKVSSERMTKKVEESMSSPHSCESDIKNQKRREEQTAQQTLQAQMTPDQEQMIPYETWWESVNRKKAYIEQYQKLPHSIEQIVEHHRKMNDRLGISNDFLNSSKK